MNHIDYMKIALTEARKGIGVVSPNPAVGALLVKNGYIISRGFHKGPGSKHAEIEAIENAHCKLENTTLYCTLEPCSTRYKGKRQDPCVERIIKEKISRIVISNIDPNPMVSGKGVEILRNSGIEVIIGILESEGGKLNEVFFKNMNKNRPFVHLKIAQTLDGKIATIQGDSKWITDEKARKDVHRLRAQYDSILIGTNTALCDNPHLTVRYNMNKAIKRIIIDSHLKIPLDSNVFSNTHLNETIILCSKYSDKEKLNILSHKGISIMQIKKNDQNYLDLDDILQKLYQRGICSMIVEGGSQIFTSFVKEQLFDKISFYIAPLLCGKGIGAFGNLGSVLMSDSINLKNTEFSTINNQILVSGYRS